MRNACVSLVVLACAISCVPQAPSQMSASAAAVPGSRVQTAYRKGVKYYSVSGQSVADIRTSLLKNGPKGADGPYYGLFSSMIVLSGTQKQNCLPIKLEVLELITLPRHTDRAQIAAPLLTRWDRMLEMLTVHELEHHKILTAEVARLESKLESLPYSSCADLRLSTQDLIKVSMKRAAVSNDSFDLVSQHGRRDGLRWP